MLKVKSCWVVMPYSLYVDTDVSEVGRIERMVDTTYSILIGQFHIARMLNKQVMMDSSGSG